MRTHENIVEKLMRRPGVREEVERIERVCPFFKGAQFDGNCWAFQ